MTKVCYLSYHLHLRQDLFDIPAGSITSWLNYCEIITSPNGEHVWYLISPPQQLKVVAERWCWATSFDKFLLPPSNNACPVKRSRAIRDSSSLRVFGPCDCGWTLTSSSHGHVRVPLFVVWVVVCVIASTFFFHVYSCTVVSHMSLIVDFFFL